MGLSERDAEREGIAARVAVLPMSAVLRTEATDETRGFMKVLVDSTDHILGFAMIGSEAGEVMAAVQSAMLAKLPYPKLRDAVITHLTMAEGLDRSSEMYRRMQRDRSSRVLEAKLPKFNGPADVADDTNSKRPELETAERER